MKQVSARIKLLVAVVLLVSFVFLVLSLLDWAAIFLFVGLVLAGIYSTHKAGRR